VKRAAPDTRTAILAAAATEFAAHGFAGASVDAIAARSRFNKAMIYYHFRSKQGLYVEILRDVFRGLGARTAEIAGSDLAPTVKVGAFLDAFNEMAVTHPYMPPMMMREMAEGAVRLDPDTLKLMARVFGSLRRILEDGIAQGAFRPANPVLAYFSLVTPVIFFHASAPIRKALDRQQMVPVGEVDAAAFMEHQKGIVLAALCRQCAGTADGDRQAGRLPHQIGATRTSKRIRSSRPGDHA
jgi:TetR/AcrR family transcriptional regulator